MTQKGHLKSRNEVRCDSDFGYSTPNKVRSTVGQQWLPWEIQGVVYAKESGCDIFKKF